MTKLPYQVESVKNLNLFASLNHSSGQFCVFNPVYVFVHTYTNDTDLTYPIGEHNKSNRPDI